ncbi:hypothetical protein [Novilysobacter arseniciresistens]|uniref:hypothetical protein n=1 Tax=Novilysobacter arseniciresistens TaxID=1385522 RepID=UPI001269C43C|nr:hypothetical protein [Lysobacter arseniciresistens]
MNVRTNEPTDREIDGNEHTSGVSWNADKDCFSFDGNRWEELDPGADRVYYKREAERVCDSLGAPERVRDELSRISKDFNQDEWAIYNLDVLAEQGFDSEDDWNNAQRKEAEVDLRSGEADENRQQGYYDGHADNSIDLSPKELSDQLRAAAVAESEWEHEQLESITVKAAGAWSPSQADADALVPTASQEHKEGQFQKHSRRL